MPANLKQSFLHKHLDPAESLGEILFGLIMTLTFTLGAGILVKEGPEAARELLVATIGCNIAWGIIDGVLYMSGQLFERSRLARFGGAIRRAASEEEAARIAAGALADMVGPVATPDDLAQFSRRVADHVRRSPPAALGIDRSDVYGALASFWLVFFSSIPAALPFLLIDDAWIALRVSNAILLGLLFLVGYRWAHYTTLRPWLAGLVLLLIGVALVLVAIRLGG
jgi:VIT1/CCC1 family predicted Fe2+/Mn2+ transporter